MNPEQPQNDGLVRYGPFTAGVNSRLPDEQLAPDMLRHAVNCDLTDAGMLSRRDGYTLELSATDAHSIYTDASGVYFADGALLKRYVPDTGAVTIVASGLTDGAGLAYLPLNGEIYYTNGFQRGKIVGGVRMDWGVEVPSGLPSLSIVGGVLESGRREVLCTFINAQGEESGSGLSTGITLTASGGILVSGIPQPVSSEIVRVNIYMTPHNGATLYLAAQLPVGTLSATIASLQPSVELASQFCAPPMPGKVLAYAGGRIYVASGPIVWYTEPGMYGRVKPSRNFIMFPSDVAIMAGVMDGLYVVADKTYFLSGLDPEQTTLREVLPYGAAFGSLAPVPVMANTWTWRSDRGQVFASNGGQMVNLQEDNLALRPSSNGASVFIERDGSRQVISVSEPPSIGSAEVGDFIEMEVRRKGAWS